MIKDNIKRKLKNLTVIFVDDEEFVVDTMREILPALFKRSYFSLNGIEAIEEVKKHNIDIVLTDLSMPKMNGIDMIKEIHKFKIDIKVVCISGHNENEFINKAKELGCSFIIKPISSNELFKALEEVL